MQLDLSDITPQYLQYRIHQRSQEYFAVYPELFRHYYQYWAKPDDLALLTADAVHEKVALLKSRLSMLQRAFTQKTFSDTVRIVLFVGANTTNGHTFWDDSRQAFVVWLPIEAYSTPLQVDVFVTHELVHALHYTRRPGFYFQDQDTKHLVGRQVITEGIATWGTLAIMGYDDMTALWADYVSPSFVRGWYAQCQEREREMARRILREWDESQERNEWFTLWAQEDVTRYRGGYYIGLQAIWKIHQEHSLDLHSLLALDVRQLEALTLTVLKEMA